jgi:hypothetical protein
MTKTSTSPHAQWFSCGEFCGYKIYEISSALSLESKLGHTALKTRNESGSTAEKSPFRILLPFPRFLTISLPSFLGYTELPEPGPYISRRKTLLPRVF